MRIKVCRVGVLAAAFAMLGCGGASLVNNLYERFVVDATARAIRALAGDLEIFVPNAAFTRETTLLLARVVGLDGFPKLLLLAGFEFLVEDDVAPTKQLDATLSFPTSRNTEEPTLFLVQGETIFEVLEADFDLDEGTVNAPIQEEGVYVVGYLED